MSKVVYADISSCEFRECLLWWQKQRLQQTATGYGRKLTTRYKVFYQGKWRRVYASCFSNTASIYIIVKGEDLYLHEYDCPTPSEIVERT